jgi:hypothetical protein
MFIVQLTITNPDPNGNPRRVWAVYEPGDVDPYVVDEKHGPVHVRLMAERSYAELHSAPDAGSGSALIDVPDLRNRSFVQMPDRHVTVTEWRALRNRARATSSMRRAKAIAARS